MPNESRVELTFWEHLVELLHRVRIMLIAVIISTIFVMVFPINLDLESLSLSNPWYETIATYVIQKLQDDFRPPDVNLTLYPISWFAPLEVYLLVSIMLGVLISLPVIAYELYKFISPALHEHERKTLTPFVISFISLFAFGFTIGYVFVVPAAIRALLLFTNLVGLSAVYAFTEFFWIVVGILLLCGLAFTLPIYIVLLVRAGILKTQSLTKNRKYIYPGIIILISFIDPEPSLITEVLVGIPLIILTEASIRIARRFEKQEESF